MIKIHPTLQTKRGIKKGRKQERDSIGVCGGGGGRPSQIPKHPLTTTIFPSKRLHLSHRAVIIQENRDQGKEWVDGWMDERQEAKKERGSIKYSTGFFLP